MTLSNKKKTSQVDHHIDRISDLPCNVIDGILVNLDIKELVTTSILSKKWRYMWTSVPRLWFSEEFFDEYEDLDDPVAYKIITNVLKQHNGRIYKFGIFIPYNYKFDITIENLNTWIPVLSRDIKHLELENQGTHLDQMSYTIFSCKELTCFKFNGFNLSIPPDFCGFKRLLELHLVFVAFEPGALESLISGCPLLKKLHIVLCENFEYFDFATPTLEDLLIEFDQNMKSICLKKAKNLIDLTLKATRAWNSGVIKNLPKNIEWISICPPLNNKILYADMIPPTLLKSSFNTLEYLKLDNVNFNERGELLYIVNVLKSAHRLVELECYSDVVITQAPEYLEELECSSCCLNRLMTVNIDVRSNSQHAMSLIQFILANSTSLEILIFKVGLYYPKLDAPLLLSISEELLWMKRASPSARVLLRY